MAGVIVVNMKKWKMKCLRFSFYGAREKQGITAVLRNAVSSGRAAKPQYRMRSGCRRELGCALVSDVRSAGGELISQEKNMMRGPPENQVRCLPHSKRPIQFKKTLIVAEQR